MGLNRANETAAAYMSEKDAIHDREILELKAKLYDMMAGEEVKE